METSSIHSELNSRHTMALLVISSFSIKVVSEQLKFPHATSAEDERE